MNLYHTSGLRCTLNTSLTNTLNKINESLFLVTNGCHIWRLPDLLVVISQTSRHPFSLKTSPGPPIRVYPVFIVDLCDSSQNLDPCLVKSGSSCTEHYPVTTINTSLAHNNMNSTCTLINTHLTHILNILLSYYK